MRALLFATLIVFASSTPAAAQSDRIGNHVTWAQPRIADILSDVVVAAAVVQPCAYSDAEHSWRRPLSILKAGWHWDGGCVGAEAGRILIAIAAAELTKRTTHHRRPDGSDDLSFFSEHTTITVAAGHWIQPKTLLLGAAVGYLRMAAGKHWATDVGTGFGVGVAIRWGAQQR